MSRILVSVRPTGPGKAFWQAHWKDRDGTRHFRGLGSKAKVTERKAKLLAREIEDQVNACTASERGDRAPTIGDWCTTVAERRGKASDATRSLYLATRAYLIERLGDVELSAVGPSEAATFVDWLRTRQVRGRTITEQTVRNHCRRAHAIWQEAIRLEKIADRNPFGAVQRTPIPVDQDWYHVDEDATRALLASARPRSLRLVVALCRLAALRRGEALRLRWQDVDFAARTIMMEHVGARTTKKRRRVVPMSQALHDILVTAFDDAIEGQPLVCHRRNAYNLVRFLHAAAKRAGLKPWDDAFNVLRRLCITDWCRVLPVADVAKIAGNSVAVIEQHYHRVVGHVHEAIAGTAPSERIELARLAERMSTEQVRALLEAAKAILDGEKATT